MFIGLVRLERELAGAEATRQGSQENSGKIAIFQGSQECSIEDFPETDLVGRGKKG
jgi:hypothetical protein